VLYEDPNRLGGAVLTSSGCIALLFTVGLVVFHHRALMQAHLLVLADKERYDCVWTTTFANCTESIAITNLVQLVRELSVQLTTRPVQLNRARGAFAVSFAAFMQGGSGTGLRRKSVAGRLSRVISRASSVASESDNHSTSASASLPAWAGLLDCGVEGILNNLHPVDSLDQLYCQAIALSPILIAKVQGWANASGGCFCSANEELEEVEQKEGAKEMQGCVSNAVGCDNVQCEAVGALPEGFVKWADIQEDELLEGGRVRWANVKSVERSIEKSTRSYGKDVSHLVDICRQSIYFSSVAGVAACLASISNDPDVRLARIKNRFDPDLDSAESAGYRNLAINLRLDTAETRALGVEIHVCEVQILLLHMAAIKNNEGHKKYILFRNLRGE